MNKATKDSIIDIIKGMNLDTVDVENIDTARSILEQGFDSLDIMDLYFKLEERYSINISEESFELQDWFTVDEIVKNINAFSSVPLRTE